MVRISELSVWDVGNKRVALKYNISYVTSRQRAKSCGLILDCVFIGPAGKFTITINESDLPQEWVQSIYELMSEKIEEKYPELAL